MTQTTGIQLGPRPGWLRRAGASQQIEALTARIVTRADRLGIVFQRSMHFEQVVISQSLSLMLFSPDETARREAAGRIANHLLDSAAQDDPSFWATNLGRALVREGGYPDVHVAKAVARNALQVSRQAVDQMIHRGDLEPAGGAYVTRESLRIAAAKRWPMEKDQ